MNETAVVERRQLPRAAMQEELYRVRDHLHQQNAHMQELAVRHADLNGAVNVVQAQLVSVVGGLADLKTSMLGVAAAVAPIQELSRRVRFLELVVFGFCALILVAVIGAWIAGTRFAP